MALQPSAAAFSPARPFAGAAPARWLNRSRLCVALQNIYLTMRALAREGRPGQWILHRDALYHPDLDTRPPSRDAARPVPIRGIPRPGLPLFDNGLVWAGTAPAPRFDDVAFWEAKRAELEDQLRQVQAGQVQPAFGPEELGVLEALEQDKDCVYAHYRQDRERSLQRNKQHVLFSLVRLAERGRPGQWVLHHEDLYHPSIDTRPQTRTADAGVAIPGVAVWKLPADGPDLHWAGRGPPPRLDSVAYWTQKHRALQDQLDQVDRGLVQPRFAAAELRTLEALERQDGHYFAACVQRARDRPPAAALAAAKALGAARFRVHTALQVLWYDGLPGRWVLHALDIGSPDYDTRRGPERRRVPVDNSAHVDDDDDDDDDRPYPIPPVPRDPDDPPRACAAQDTARLHYRGPRPWPDLADVAFWERTEAALEALHRDVLAGRVERHRFTAADCMRLALADHELDYGQFYQPAKRTTGVRDWLGGVADGAAGADEVEVVADKAEAADDARQHSVEALKRRRPSGDGDDDNDNDDDDNDNEHEARPATKRPRREVAPAALSKARRVRTAMAPRRHLPDSTRRRSARLAGLAPVAYTGCG